MSYNTVWRCGQCKCVNYWSNSSCARCHKSYNGETQRWECTRCDTVNAMDEYTCSSCKYTRR